MVRRPLFSLFRKFSSISHRLARRLTDAGRLLLTGVVATAVLGFDTSSTLIYQLFVFLSVLFVLSMTFAPFFRPLLEVRRTLPRFATVGEPLHHELILRNRSGKILRRLTIMEDLADPRPTLEEFLAAREPGERRRNWFDRKVGFYRFVWLILRKRGLHVEKGRLEQLPPGQQTTIKMTATPSRRGVVRFVGVTVARTDPLNLFHGFHRCELPQSLLILPRRYRIPGHFRLSGGRQHQPGGESLAASVGESEEFVSLRDYRSGDPLRRMHWPSLAKCGKPVIKEFQEEYFTRFGLILDTFAVESDAAFEEAVSIASSFAVTLERGDALLDLMFVGPRAFRFTAGRGLAHGEQMLEILASVEARKEGAFVELTALVLSHAAALSGLLLVLIAWDGERQELVRRLTALSIPVHVFLVTESPAPASLDRTPLGAHPQRLHLLEAGSIQQGLDRL